MQKQGFTLVELSITLIIIGLLIGGILAARSMISTVKVQNFIKQAQQYDIAVSNFRDAYKQWPGDSNLFPAIFAGNNDGYITQTSGSTDGESHEFWSELSAADFSPTGVNYSSIPGIVNPGVNIPLSQLGTYQGKPIGVYVIQQFNSTINLTSKWYYFGFPYINPFAPNAATGARMRATYPFKTQDVLAIDIKIDDGISGADTGSPGSYLPSNSYTGNVVGTGTNCTISGDGINYNIANSGSEVCGLWIKIQSSAGK